MSKITPEWSAKFANMGLLCACMVVMRHIGLVPERGKLVWWVWQLFVSYDALTMVAVPFFFLASGFFLGGHVGEEKWYSREVRKRINSLLIPFVAWNLIYFVLMIALDYIAGIVGFHPHILIPAHATIADLFNAVGLNPFCSPALGPLWFIRTLFLFVLASVFLCRFCQKNRIVPIFAIMVFLLSMGMRFLGNDGRQIVEFTFSLEGLFYFVAGMSLRQHPITLARPRLIGVIALVCGLVTFVLLALVRYFSEGVYLLPYRLVGTLLLMIGLLFVLPGKKVFGGYSDLSFPLYLLHEFILVAMAGLVSCLGWREIVVHNSFLYFVRLLIVVFLVRMTFSVLQRGFPKMTSLLLGGRA